MNSASSVTVTKGKSIPRRNAGGSEGYDAPGQDKDKKDHDEWTIETKSIVARYEELLGLLERNMATRYSDPAMSLRNASKNTEKNCSWGHIQKNGRSQMTNGKEVQGNLEVL